MRTNCPNCGAVIDPSADRCAYCGTPYIEKPERYLLTMDANGYTLRTMPATGAPCGSLRVDAEGITYQTDGGAPVTYRLRPDERGSLSAAFQAGSVTVAEACERLGWPSPPIPEHGTARRDNWLTRCFGIKSPSQDLQNLADLMGGELHTPKGRNKK